MLVALGALVVYLQPSVPVPAPSVVPVISELLQDIVTNGREFAACCQDKMEQYAISSALDNFQGDGERLAAVIRTRDVDANLVRHDCLRRCGELVAVLCPSSLKNIMHAPEKDKLPSHSSDSQYSASSVSSMDVSSSEV